MSAPAGYQPIENYGVIGNLHTVALVGMHGSIDWFCLPHFDSPSIFGGLLDARKGGRFVIAPVHVAGTPHQTYLPDTNILITRFLHPDGAGEIIDFMPIAEDPNDDTNHHHLYRVVRVVKGRIRFRADCTPAFNYGLDTHRVVKQSNGYLFESKRLAFSLVTDQSLRAENGGVHAEFALSAGESRYFVICHVEGGHRCPQIQPAGPALEATVAYWRRWVKRMRYQGRWREMVTRSALTLKMLTFAPTGAIVAAATTSLPERLGGTRNWDYRYTWIRDASFTLYGLLRLGYSDEAAAFMGWLKNRMGELNPDGSMNVMYGLHGEHNLAERSLRHLEGYKGSAPVRIGNAAFHQRQLDIYGELMDSVYLYNKYGSPIPYELWMRLRDMIDFVCKAWRSKDKGIWEIRSGPQHFVYSKVMCWVAVDRALRMAQKRSLPADWSLWMKTRDAIYLDVMKHGWDAKQNSFIQYYGSKATDASTLMLPLVKFISPTDPRMIGTLDRIQQTLVSDSLVYRYDPQRGVADGVGGGEGTFSMCTFWYAEALARAGRHNEARWIFEKMLGYANHVGLFAEEVGPTGEQLGNFPQAFTHLALISAAYNIDRALDRPAASIDTDHFNILS